MAVASQPFPFSSGVPVEKVYSLPDLARLPYSDTQALLVRLLEYRDFTVLPALFDLLAESGEETLLTDLRKEMYSFAVQKETDPDPAWLPRWESVAERLLIYGFHLIYTIEAALSVLSKQRWRSNENPPTGDVTGFPAMPLFTAEGDIPAGAVVAFDNVNNTVRIHPNPPVQ